MFNNIPKQQLNLFFLICSIAGAIVGYQFALSSGSFNLSAEQTAWQYASNANVIAGSRSFWFPLEPMSLIVSKLAALFTFLNHIIPSLSLAVIVLHTLISFWQMQITAIVFGKQSAAFFALWQIAAVPLLLPLNTVVFSLDSLNSISPFLFMWLISQTPKTKINRLKIAAYLSLLSVLALQNLLYLPLFYIAIRLISRETENKKLLYRPLLLACLFVPIMLYSFYLINGNDYLADLKQQLNSVTFTSDISDYITRPALLVLEILPKGLYLFSLPQLAGYSLSWLFFAIFVIAFGSIIKLSNFYKRIELVALLLIVVYVFGYCLTVFFKTDINKIGFFSLRHLAYILPFLFATILHATLTNKLPGKILVLSLIIGSAIASVYYFDKITRQADPNNRAAGWLLAKKFGADSEKLTAIAEKLPYDSKNDLYFGIGWGLTTKLLRDAKKTDNALQDSLIFVISSFDQQHRLKLLEGIDYAFSPGVTPVLDSTLKQALHQKLNQSPNR